MSSGLVMGLILISFTFMVEAADLDDERDLAEQLSTRNSPEEVLKLEVSGIPFQGLYRDSPLKKRRGGIILLHGRKSNQDAGELIHPLRVALPNHGWATLTIALPQAETQVESENFSSLMPESVGRLRSAVTALKQKELADIALIGHDSGAWVVLNYMLQQPDPEVRALILVDPASIRGLAGFPVKLEKLSTIKIPLLELLSQRQASVPDEEARERKTAMKGVSDYRQITIEVPSTLWSAVQDYLIERIHGWLGRILARPNPQATPTAAAP